MDLGTTDRILIALYRLSRDTCAVGASELARATGLRATAAAHGLLALERVGLADATRARLTMLGLARAARLDVDRERGGSTPRHVATSIRARKAPVASPLAAAGDSDAPPPDWQEDPLRYPDDYEQDPLEKPLQTPLYRPLRLPLQGRSALSERVLH